MYHFGGSFWSCSFQREGFKYKSQILMSPRSSGDLNVLKTEPKVGRNLIFVVGRSACNIFQCHALQCARQAKMW